jgi:acyl carrier protein
MSETFEQQVIRIVAEAKNLDPATVTAQSTMKELGVDSLDGMSIIFDLENAFEIEIPEDAAQRAETVGDLIEGVRRLVEARGSA